MTLKHRSVLMALFFCLVLFLGEVSLPAETGKKTLQFSDLMGFRQIHDLSTTSAADWLVFTSRPDRGVSHVSAVRVADGHTVILEGHDNPTISADGEWLLAHQSKDPNLYTAPDEKKDEGKSLTLLNIRTGKRESFQQIFASGFDSSGKWLFLRLLPENSPESSEKSPKPEKTEQEKRTTLRLIYLAGNHRVDYPNILYEAMDPDSPKLAMVSNQQLILVDLSKSTPKATTLCSRPDHLWGQPVWSEKGSSLAALVAIHARNEFDDHPEQTIFFWYPKLKSAREIPLNRLPTGWIIPPEGPLKWDHFGTQLSFGTRPLSEYLVYNPLPVPSPQGHMNQSAPYTDLLADSRLEIWHWQDPQIKSQQKAQLKKLIKQTYTAIFTPGSNQLLQLGGPEMKNISLIDGAPFALGFDNVPYSLDTTWDGFYEDVYIIDLKTGQKQPILTRNEHSVSLSPQGRYLAYFKQGNWILYDRQTDGHKNLTQSIAHSFADEDHDQPQAAPPYGLAGWLPQDRAFFFYDRFDIWRHEPKSGKTVCITSGEGRKQNISFRYQKTDPDLLQIPDGAWLLSAYSQKEKWTRFYQGGAEVQTPSQLTDGNFTYRYVSACRNKNLRLFTRERLEVYPDLWVSSPDFQAPRQLTNLNPQIDGFNWGRSELIKWKSNDGLDLEGVVIKPENYRPGAKYPIIVYYYELSADRLLTYNQTVVNHRPSFPLYASNGYVIFLPDIRFQTGRPGQSAVDCLVPGVLKLIDLGIADPKAIALHGHSWSGYQTAYVITQTDLFACALAGAPVANMTSAYSGIRWGEGVARQFQYEKSQSRIGKSLFDAPWLYIENSPVFYAEQINTPLLIEHGDEDEAVPWTQSIELYLAMRRLQKPCVFLQYNQEPHHLKQYANKLDYAIRMKAFFDHFLKGAPAPDWWERAEPTGVKPLYKKKPPETKKGS